MQAQITDTVSCVKFYLINNLSVWNGEWPYEFVIIFYGKSLNWSSLDFSFYSHHILWHANNNKTEKTSNKVGLFTRVETGARSKNDTCYIQMCDILCCHRPRAANLPVWEIIVISTHPDHTVYGVVTADNNTVSKVSFYISPCWQFVNPSLNQLVT